MATERRDLSPQEPGPQLPDQQALKRVPMLETSTGALVRPRSGRPVRIAPPRAAVDICFVFDTTGSMYGKIDGLVRCMVDLVHELAKLKLDWRITAVPFGDLTVPGDRVVDSLPFVASQAEAEHLLQTMPRFSGGGNVGESSLEAMLAALNKPYRPDAVKVLVALTDDYPLESWQLTTKTVERALRAKEAICFVASPSGIPGYKRWAQNNGGSWYEIGPSMDTATLLQFLRSLVKDLAQVAKAVHELGGGSVRRYLDAGEGRHRELPSSS